MFVHYSLTHFDLFICLLLGACTYFFTLPVCPQGMVLQPWQPAPESHLLGPPATAGGGPGTGAPLRPADFHPGESRHPAQRHRSDGLRRRHGTGGRRLAGPWQLQAVGERGAFGPDAAHQGGSGVGRRAVRAQQERGDPGVRV